MVNKKSWKEFRECGMLWWINMILSLEDLENRIIQMAISK